MTQNSPRLLLVGHHIAGSGFGRVVQHIRKAALPHFDVHQLGLGYRGQATITDGYHLYPEKLPNEDSGQYHSKRIGRLLNELQPHLFLVIHDFLYIRFILESLRYVQHPMKTCVYLALDGKIVKTRKMISPLKKVDSVVLYTNFARQQVRNLITDFPSLLKTKVHFEQIPHGVETDLFYPIGGIKSIKDQQEGRIRAKKQLFPSLEEPEKTFLVFNGNRLDPRKRLDTTIKAFAQFAKGKSKHIKLYLHTPFSRGKIEDFIIQMAKKEGIEDRLLKLAPAYSQGVLENKTLNLLYNAADLGINTCEGEGWGLVSCEHAATGAPQVLPAHTSFPEIWTGAAHLIPPTETKSVNYSNHAMYDLDAASFAQAIEKIYTDKVYRLQLAEAGYQRMQTPDYRWQNITKRWEQHLLSFL